eukprot:1727962-Alexandrium_andersonii.AAC.1
MVLACRPDAMQVAEPRVDRVDVLPRVALSLRVSLPVCLRVPGESDRGSTEGFADSFFAFECPNLCGHIHRTVAKPQSDGRQWPQF